jgi:hypothetical protein
MFDEKTLRWIGRDIDKQTDDLKLDILLNPPTLATVTDCIVKGEQLELRFIIENKRPYRPIDSECEITEQDDSLLVTTDLWFPIDTKLVRSLRINEIKEGGEFTFTGEHHYSVDGCGEGCLTHRRHGVYVYEVVVFTDGSARIKCVEKQLSR